MQARHAGFCRFKSPEHGWPCVGDGSPVGGFFLQRSQGTQHYVYVQIEAQLIYVYVDVACAVFGAANAVLYKHYNTAPPPSQPPLLQRAGYAARSAYKLQEIQNKHRVIRPGNRILDLGCHPGAWMQVACQSLGPLNKGGSILGVDIQVWFGSSAEDELLASQQGRKCLCRNAIRIFFAVYRRR